MVGQKKFTMVSKYLQEARSHYKDKSFGTIWVVLLWDFKQLPSVCDSPLFNENGINPSGYNLYQFLTSPSPSPNLCDRKELTKQASGPN